MRGLFLLVGVGLFVGACSSSTTNVTNVVGADGGEDGASPPADSGPDASPPLDAGEDALVDAEPESFCKGPPAAGPASDNCEPQGVCTLGTCAGGVIFRCRQGAAPYNGYPSTGRGCSFSTGDSTAQGGGSMLNCCEPACVRHAARDLGCSMGKPKAITCATNAPAPAGCDHIPGADNVYGKTFCCP